MSKCADVKIVMGKTNPYMKGVKNVDLCQHVAYYGLLQVVFYV